MYDLCRGQEIQSIYYFDMFFYPVRDNTLVEVAKKKNYDPVGIARDLLLGCEQSLQDVWFVFLCLLPMFDL